MAKDKDNATFRVAVEGYSPNDGDEVSLDAISRNEGIELLMKQGEGTDEQISVAMTLSHKGFLDFLRLARMLLSVAVGVEPDAND